MLLLFFRLGKICSLAVRTSSRGCNAYQRMFYCHGTTHRVVEGLIGAGSCKEYELLAPWTVKTGLPRGVTGETTIIEIWLINDSSSQITIHH